MEEKHPEIALTFSEPFPPHVAGGFPCEPTFPTHSLARGSKLPRDGQVNFTTADFDRVNELAKTNLAELGIIDDPQPKVTIATDPAAKKPEVTVWRVGEDGQEYADFPLANPEDLERLNKEIPLTPAQLDQLTKKIARNMLRDALKDTRQKKRLKQNKAAKQARRRGR